MNFNTPKLLMINVFAFDPNMFAVVHPEKAVIFRNRGWATMLLKDVVYQQEGSKLRIAVTKFREPGKVSTYTKPSEEGLKELALSKTFLEFEQACKNYFSTDKTDEDIVQVWKNRELSETRARVLATFRKDNDYQLPENHEWLEVDLDVFDLREQLEEYLELGFYPATVDLDKALHVDRDLIANFILIKLPK